ncbi:hypothetical protein OG558_23950 [Kribbella sp. NBC_01510]|uniref:hypothetical protein n=1 Tax=Kribbella sp. NBC_01510 TaxID=2903581 RepID=UPI00386C26B0
MLPLRLETRFTTPDAGHGWLLKVRVVPDAASLDRHDPLPTVVELDAVERLWQFADGDLGTAHSQTQWRRFAAQVGAARGAWLARAFPAVEAPDAGWTINRPEVGGIRDGLAAGRVGGLPKSLELWMGRSGAAPARIAQLEIDHTKLGLDLPDPASEETRWWSSFKHAQEVGLGIELDIGPVTPDDIDVLYVVGIGEERPDQLFQNHRDAGTLGVLALGAPTNTVDGEPAADLARDPQAWLDLLTNQGPQTGARALGHALAGDRSALLPLPGGDTDYRQLNHALVAGLWSALYGHAIKDIWGAGNSGDLPFELGIWAAGNLIPDGPVPPIRVGDQPYGVLPVTSAARWVADPKDPRVEMSILKIGTGLRDAAAEAADRAGTTVGADTDRLLDLVGQLPNSRGYAWRWQLSLDLMYQLKWAFGQGISFADLVTWWNKLAQAALDLGGPPARRYATIGFPQDLRLPLVVPTNLGVDHDLYEMLKRLHQAPAQYLATPGTLAEWFRPIPNSLLFRLLLHARLVDAAEVVRASARDAGPLLEPIQASSIIPTALSSWGRQFDEHLLTGDAPSQLYELGRKAIIELLDEISRLGPDLTELERAFRGALDTASYRIDPWLTGVAWRRLQTLVDTDPETVFWLGAYGWVDSPKPRTSSTFTPEYLHAPSHEQALTAAILRDRALSDQDVSRWKIELESDRVRLAAELAAEVRLGRHLSEVTGRSVEHLVGTRATVDALRRAYPIRSEHGGRRTCDGLRVIADSTDNPAALLGLGLSPETLVEIGKLSVAVDVYGDLLVSDAVYDVVSGRTDQAAAAMEAAAGLAAPPTLDVIRTPRGGRTARTTVAVAIPDVPGPAAPDSRTSPGLLAEPAVAAFLEAVTGAPDSSDWTWQARDADGLMLDTMTLADLELLPIDTLSLSAADLSAQVLTQVPGAAWAGPVGGVADGPVELPAQGTAQRLADLLGSRPALPADVAIAGEPPSATDVQAELADRYSAVHALAQDAQATIGLAVSGTASEQAVALRDALRWGITPLTADDAPLGTLVSRAAAALAERIQKAPLPEAVAELAPAGIARAMSELVSPEGRLPVLARMALAAFPTSVTAEPAAGPPADGTGRIDGEWLETVAAVRPALARLEAHQLSERIGLGSPFASWTSRPGDPWQVDHTFDAEAGAGLAHGLLAETQLLAVFGPVGTFDPPADPAQTIALGLLDSWSEVVPATDHATTAAFHYDAPGSRAPQAILLAVPPDVSMPLDAETLIDILAETRILTRARAAGQAELDAHAAGLPLITLPVDQPTGVELAPK